MNVANNERHTALAYTDWNRDVHTSSNDNQFGHLSQHEEEDKDQY